ncbi:MAG TPA: DUF742 domain-containing protein [Streptosporangiaceae bacterium]|jgi:hypothetical protein|nr:DUF742 domain-containing protein [Streptosporangiaceae bacterium]
MSGQGEYHDRPVRLYVVTGGRVRPSRNTIRPETLLVATDTGRQLPVSASSEERSLLRMCRRLLSLVETAVHLELPVSVVSVVASDLIDAGFLAVRGSGDEPACGATRADPGDVESARPDRKLLQEVLDGLRKLG